MTDEELLLYEKLAEALESVQIQADHASTVTATMREALKKTCPEFDKEFEGNCLPPPGAFSSPIGLGFRREAWRLGLAEPLLHVTAERVDQQQLAGEAVGLVVAVHPAPPLRLAQRDPVAGTRGSSAPRWAASTPAVRTGCGPSRSGPGRQTRRRSGASTPTPSARNGARRRGQTQAVQRGS